MSRYICRHTERKLPDSVTCGGLCGSFPACIPMASVGLVADVHRLRMDAEHEAEGNASTAESLSLIRRALVAGLKRKGRD